MKFDPKSGEWIADEGSPESKLLNAIKTRQQKISTPQPKPKKSNDDIYNEISKHEIFGYALRLYEHVRESMEMYQLKNRPIFRNRNGSFHKWNHQTKMGPEIFLAEQPSWPFKYSINGVHEIDGEVYIERAIGKLKQANDLSEGV